MRIEPSNQPGFHDVTFTWRDHSSVEPSRAVLVRLVSHTDAAFDTGDLDRYMMDRGEHGEGWELTLTLPSALRTSYQICPIPDDGRVGQPSPERWAEICHRGLPDPTNPKTLPAGVTFGNARQASVLELPEAPTQPWQVRQAGVPAGSTSRHAVVSSAGTPTQVHLYLPRGHRATVAYPVLVMFDAGMWANVDVAATFDNLIAAGRIPPIVVAGIESGRGPERWRQLTYPSVFEPLVWETLLPWLRASWSVSARPGDLIVAGQSLGAIAAAHLARSRPELVGWMIGQSPALWWPGDAGGGLSGRDVIDSHVERPANGSTRYFLEAGSTEGALLDSARSFRDALTGSAKEVLYREYEGGHDLACWRGGLADGLVAALG
ncbi:alpha/beta hydrolase-fold protein [Asanoa sp. NPDC049573]|uniref:alpha/beta hydrolase-fold protein n=1 Tax=Asanoa sp. NPDC049573 TaxID=3155396 RepID=UPI00343E68F9